MLTRLYLGLPVPRSSAWKSVIAPVLVFRGRIFTEHICKDDYLFIFILKAALLAPTDYLELLP